MKRYLVLLGTLLSLLIGSISLITNAATENKDAVALTFWHASGGNARTAITKMVSDFNKVHPDITVVEQFQGSYVEALAKLKSSLRGGQGPDIMQVYDVGTRWMADSKVIIPAYKMIKAENYDTSFLEKNILAYYTVKGKLYSMPFNTSTPILYYNKTLFKQAGLDPEQPPKNLDEILECAKVLTQKDNNGKVIRSGIAIKVEPWFFEEWLVKQELPYVNNHNGRQKPATAVEYLKNGGGLKIFEKWKKIADSGFLGIEKTSAEADASFIAGRTAMDLTSTGSLKDIMNGVAGKFEVGTAFFPNLNAGDKGGVSIGGGSLWMLDKHDTRRSKAAWEFMKFMVQPEQQAYWNLMTGYMPVNVKAYDFPEVKQFLQEKPQFKTAIDQLHVSTPESQGALLSSLPEVRNALKFCIEKMLSGEMTPEEAIKKAAADSNQIIERYNKTNSNK